jgi:hypothetical protein
MSITAFMGPVNVYGQAAVPPAATSGMALDYNPHRGPSLFDQGLGLMDPRYPYSFQPGGTSKTAYGWLGGGSRFVICDQVPSTLTVTAIAAAQVPVAGTAMTLVSSTAAGITVGTTITSATTGASVTGLLAIDGAMVATSFGSSNGNNFWDPTKAIARAVSIASAGNDSGATFTVRGYDVYGYPMTETITGANVGTATGAKAFKYIASITPAGTLSGSNASAGQSDKIGFMLRSDLFQYIQIYWPDTTLISASTGYTAAVTTSPATATTGDVRGTYSLQGSASNNTRRLVITATIPLANIGTTTGLVGVTQV